jgi:hypothetical protein
MDIQKTKKLIEDRLKNEQEMIKSFNELELKPIRQILKFPQTANMYSSFMHEINGLNICGHNFTTENSNYWRKQHFNFCGGGIYSVARFHELVYNRGDADGDRFNNARSCCPQSNIGIIQTNDYGYSGNSYYELCPNARTCEENCTGSYRQVFGANWLNMSIYLPQTGVLNTTSIDGVHTNTQFTINYTEHEYDACGTYYSTNNSQVIAGNYTNTCSFARSDFNWTDFICVPKEDICAMSQIGTKGFCSNDNGTIIIPSGNYMLQGTYRNGINVPDIINNNGWCWCAATPLYGGRCCGDCNCSQVDCRTYFYKGFDSSNVIDFLFCLGIV